MADPFLGEIRMFGGNFAPLSWALCNGQLMSISQNTALFSLLGTTYGGDGVTTFALPDLRGRVPVHAGTLGSDNFVLGQPAGVEAVTLATAQLPAHTHTVNTTAAAGTANVPSSESSFSPTWGRPAPRPSTPTSRSMAQSQVALNSGAVSPAGGNVPHDNMQPFLALNFIIATEGIYPSQN